MPFKKGGKPGPGRPRKDTLGDRQRLAADTAANAIRKLHAALEELEHGHPSLKAGLTADFITAAIRVLDSITTPAAKQRAKPPHLHELTGPHEPRTE